MSDEREYVFSFYEIYVYWKAYTFNSTQIFQQYDILNVLNHVLTIVKQNVTLHLQHVLA
jgi:hypothetical protein